MSKYAPFLPYELGEIYSALVSLNTAQTAGEEYFEDGDLLERDTGFDETMVTNAVFCINGINADREMVGKDTARIFTNIDGFFAPNKAMMALFEQAPDATPKILRNMRRMLDSYTQRATVHRDPYGHARFSLKNLYIDADPSFGALNVRPGDEAYGRTPPAVTAAVRLKNQPIEAEFALTVFKEATRLADASVDIGRKWESKEADTETAWEAARKVVRVDQNGIAVLRWPVRRQLEKSTPRGQEKFQNELRDLSSAAEERSQSIAPITYPRDPLSARDFEKIERAIADFHTGKTLSVKQRQYFHNEDPEQGIQPYVVEQALSTDCPEASDVLQSLKAADMIGMKTKVAEPEQGHSLPAIG